MLQYAADRARCGSKVIVVGHTVDHAKMMCADVARAEHPIGGVKCYRDRLEFAGGGSIAFKSSQQYQTGRYDFIRGEIEVLRDHLAIEKEYRALLMELFRWNGPGDELEGMNDGSNNRR